MQASVLIVATLVCSSVAAQQRLAPEVLLERKLASPFLKRADWVLGYATALDRARKRGVPIFGYFTTAGP